MALGIVLKTYMDKNNIGNKELSKLSGVPIRTINNILAGITENPTLETVKALAHALGCTLDELAENLQGDSIHTIAAHHDGEDWTEEELDEIETFKKFVLSKRDEK